MKFFSCVLKDACLIDVLTVKNNNVEAFIREAAEHSTCPDTEMVCCHDLNKKVEVESSSPKSSEIDTGDYYDQADDKEYCSAYENEGFR